MEREREWVTYTHTLSDREIKGFKKQNQNVPV